MAVIIASVAEWSIASDCKSDGLRPTGVQIPPGAQKETSSKLKIYFTFAFGKSG